MLKFPLARYCAVSTISGSKLYELNHLEIVWLDLNEQREWLIQCIILHHTKLLLMLGACITANIESQNCASVPSSPYSPPQPHNVISRPWVGGRLEKRPDGSDWVTGRQRKKVFRVETTHDASKNIRVYDFWAVRMLCYFQNRVE